MKIIYIFVVLVVAVLSVSAQSLEKVDSKNVAQFRIFEGLGRLPGNLGRLGDDDNKDGNNSLVSSISGKIFDGIFGIKKVIASAMAKIATDGFVGVIWLIDEWRQITNKIVDRVFAIFTPILKGILKMKINIFKGGINLLRNSAKSIHNFLKKLPLIGRIFGINEEIMNAFSKSAEKNLNEFLENEKNYLMKHKDFILPRISYIKMMLKDLDVFFKHLTEKPAILFANEFWVTLRKIFEQQIDFMDAGEKFFESNGKSGSLGIDEKNE